MCTRAIHLELVCDLSTDSFLAAFSRFTARSGMPSEVISDNGSNFIGARSELMELQKFFNQLKSYDGVELLSTKYEMLWKFSPPKTPHFGGLWERAVRSMKSILKKIMKDKRHTYDEFETCLCTAESLLNSRPILPLDSLSPDGPTSLTAGHFLVGRHLRLPPIPSQANVKISRLKR